MYLLLSLFIAYACAIAPMFDENHPEKIDGQYIVIYHPTTDDITQQKHQSAVGANVKFTYNITENFMGYSAALTEEQLDFVRRDPAVKAVHCDHEVHLFDYEQTCTGSESSTPSWGLVRVSQWGAYTNNGIYKWNVGKAGQGVRVYVIDTGIRTTHTEFDGRAVWGYNAVDNIRTDDNGHGTHCAGTIGGSWVGVARDATLVAVRVLNGQGSGTNSGVIAGINWVRNDGAGKNSIGSMSLGGGYSAAMNQAVAAVISAGIPVAVAAGNDNRDACSYSPASEPTAITVGSTDSRDTRSTFSNYGSCVDIFAPGTSIYSAGIASDTAYATFSGTSMACPHVAGVAAIVRGNNPRLNPGGTKDFLRGEGTTGRVTNPGTGSPNILAYNGC